MGEPLHDEELSPPVDPFEAELVAYLDGELDAAAARRVEARLASDPQARSRATVLKKTFDLLDYLPKPEPSATFASRTLDRLPAVQGAAPAPAQSAPAPGNSHSRSLRSSPSVVPLIPSRSVMSAVAPRPPKPRIAPQNIPWGRRTLWGGVMLFGVAVFTAVGYFVTAAVRSHHPAALTSGGRDATDEPLDRRIVENLPLYLAVDDFGFATTLAKPNWFGDDPAVSYDSTLKTPAVQRSVTSAAFAAQEHDFRSLPPERQHAIRELDRRLYEEPKAEQDRLLRVLEVYSAWYRALPDSDRRTLQSSAAADLRLARIRELREQQWFEQLPAAQREQLKGQTDDTKRKRIEEWRADEVQRRLEWASVKSLDFSRTPWPFDSEARRNDIIAFAKAAFRLDDKPDAASSSCRLSANDLDRYTSALNFALAQGGAAWQIYGRTLYETLQKRDPRSNRAIDELLLPPAGESKLNFTTFGELPTPFQSQRVRERLVKKVPASLSGKWPEFPLEIHKDVPSMHKEMPGFLAPKGDTRSLPPLGPSRTSEFTPAVRDFLAKELFPKLNDADRKTLAKDEGKWPDYSRELIRLSRKHDLSMPGVMLPGSPAQWEAKYGKAANVLNLR